MYDSVMPCTHGPLGSSSLTHGSRVLHPVCFGADWEADDILWPARHADPRTALMSQLSFVNRRAIFKRDGIG